MLPIKTYLKKILNINENEDNRDKWLKEILLAMPQNLRILDAGAGELRNKPLCSHLQYVSQDICQYEGHGNTKGLQTGAWDTSRIDIVSDISDIPEADASFDIILCTEVFEHLSNPLTALDEFARLLKPNGQLIITAPFASLVHFAPYHYATGFSRYWYEYHLPARQFTIQTLTANGDWFSYAKQEILRLPSMARHYGDRCWWLAYLVAGMGIVYFALRRKTQVAEDVACFGWHCIAVKD